LPQQPWAQYS